MPPARAEAADVRRGTVRSVRRRLVSLLATLSVAIVAIGVVPTTPGKVAATDGEFVETQVARLLDTRPGHTTVDGLFAGTGSIGPGDTLAFDVVGRAGVPAGVVAVAVTVTVTQPTAAGFVSIFPCGPVPITSTVNYQAGQTVANSAISGLSGNGQLCIHTMSPTHVVVDVTAAFADGFVPVPNTRLLDTRPGEPTGDGSFAGGGLLQASSVLELQVAGRSGVPTDAKAVALTITTTGSTRAGYVTAFPCGPPPLASTVNHVSGEHRSNSLVVPLSGTGSVCLFTLAPTQLVVDVSGYVPANSSYTPVSPTRLADTRFDGLTADGACMSVGRVATGTSMSLRVAGRAGVPATGVGAVALNVVATGSKRTGFVTSHRTDSAVPNASMLNYAAADTVAASVIAPVDAHGRVSLFSNVGVHLVVDVVGWFPGTSSVPTAEPCAGTFVDPRQTRQVVVTEGRVGCALSGERFIQCWFLSMLGFRPSEPPSEPFAGDLVELAISNGALCALRTDGTVTCRTSHASSVTDVVVARPIVDLVGHGDGFCGIDDTGHVVCWAAPSTAGQQPTAIPVRTSGPATGFVPLSTSVGPVAVQTSAGTADVLSRRPDGTIGIAWTSREASPGRPWSTVVSARAYHDGQMCLVLVDGRATCGSSGDLAPELDVEWNGGGAIRGPGGDVLNVWHDEDTGLFHTGTSQRAALVRLTTLDDCYHIGVPLPDGWCRPAEPAG